MAPTAVDVSGLKNETEMDSAIGKGLRQSPRLLAMTTAVAAAILSLALILTTPAGQKVDSGRGAYLTLATVTCLYLGFLASHVPGMAGALGFRWAPKQGWRLWLWVGAVLSVAQFVAVII